jgi:hypothetical protein
MAFKFNPNAAEDRKYVTKAGTYTATVQGAKQDYLPPRADLYARITFVTSEGETVFGDLFAKPDKSGGHERLEQFLAASATDEEVKEYVAGGELEVDESFLEKILARARGRNLKVRVTERKYTKKDGTEGVAYQASFFTRLPNGPVIAPF